MGWVFLNFPSSSLLPACRKLQRKFNICLRPATQPPYINTIHKYSSRNSKQYCTIFHQINENRWNLDSFSLTPTPTPTTYLLNTDSFPIRREVAHKIGHCSLMRSRFDSLWGFSLPQPTSSWNCNQKKISPIPYLSSLSLTIRFSSRS